VFFLDVQKKGMKTEMGLKDNRIGLEESTKILEIEELSIDPFNNAKITTNSGVAFNNCADNFTAIF